MMAQLRRRRIIKIDCQIDTRPLQVDVIVAGQHSQRDGRVAVSEIPQRRHQPALGYQRARIDRQAARELLVFDVQNLLIEAIQRRLQRPVNALPFSRQLHFAVRADKELDPQLLFQLINPVTDGAWGERKLVCGQGERLVPRRHLKRRQPGELPAVEQPGT